MRFLARYHHEGAWYLINFTADTWADAEMICKRHSLVLDGEHKFTIGWPLGLIAQILFGTIKAAQEKPDA